ncbi:glycoside hydrolase domain-containing protein [Saccharothrix yanglingensis]|uniref:Rv2525c-like glycoside hydrolase-like domain-containing protein n=1 Tax=Saccharothrix yanglingensis TaxID=659496 RepID=A0ABU0WWE3_9PSEU|nr:glycoside hydrolase domain-containing protein [Saccharothrix yanglingensis]MDQ2583697.1 hypothetical protein [Saccharothrix yanglingensis]
MPAPTGFGLDYSARELSPAEIDDYNRRTPHQPISFLIRYIGYPANRKCISAYPGALRAHEAAGRLVLLVHQIGYRDFEGGRAAGRAHATTALADARAQGYPGNRPIFFAFDRWLSGNSQAGPLTLGQVWDYLQGAVDVLGATRVGLYGFHDVIHPAVREKRVRWTWLCGAESGVREGVDFYQWNNGRVYPGGLECDLNKAYVDLSGITGGNDVGLVEGFTDEGFVQLVHHKKVSTPDPEGAPDVQLSMGQLLEGSWRGAQRIDTVVVPLLAQIARNPDVDADGLRDVMFQAAREQGRVIGEQVGTALGARVREGLERLCDVDDLDEARRTARELLRLLGSAAPTGTGDA